MQQNPNMYSYASILYPVSSVMLYQTRVVTVLLSEKDKNEEAKDRWEFCITVSICISSFLNHAFSHIEHEDQLSPWQYKNHIISNLLLK